MSFQGQSRAKSGPLPFRVLVKDAWDFESTEKRLGIWCHEKNVASKIDAMRGSLKHRNKRKSTVRM